MSRRKTNLVIFIEGSFIPSFDGYSLVMSNVCKLVNRFPDINLTIVHCYRGWSDIDMIKETGYRVMAVDPETYYLKPEKIIELIGLKSVDIIQMQDPELIVGMGGKLREHYACKLLFHPLYSSGRIADSSQLSIYKKNITKKYEKAALDISDAILCLTATDREYLSSSYKIMASKISIYSPPAFDLNQSLVSRPGKGRSIFYLGSLYFQPNVEAVKRLVKLYPKLEEFVENIYIIGEKPPALFSSVNMPAFKFLGKVNDLRPLLSEVNMGLFPINEGSGVRSKILFCFNAGIPVVGTPAAFQGLKGCDKLICIDENELIDKTKNILNNYELQEEISLWERKYMKRHFNINKIKQQLSSIYQLVANMQNKSDTSSLPFKEPLWLEEYKNMNKQAPEDLSAELPIIINDNDIV